MNLSTGALKKNRLHPRFARLATSLAFYAFLVLSTVFAGFIFLLTEPVSGVTSTSTQLVSDKKVYTQGDIALFASPGEYCNNGYTVTLNRDYSTERGFLRLPAAGTYAPPAPYCETGAVFPSVIPEDLPPGEWQLILRISYNPNPLRTVTITKTSNIFVVRAPASK